MKYFIFAMENIQFGIPTERTERVISVKRVQSAVCETENAETFVSLPVLFGHKEMAAPHGVVLKSENNDKTILLAPPIDIDLDIPEENIHLLPKVFADVLVFFRGVYFDGQKMILILNPEKCIAGK